MKLTLLLTVTLFTRLVHGIAGDTTNSFPHLSYAPVEIRIVDDNTKRPLVGALVSPYCLGGTTYATNTYLTDTNGFVRATFIDGGLIAIRVTMSGYETSSVALAHTNRVVSLRKRKR